MVRIALWQGLSRLKARQYAREGDVLPEILLPLFIPVVEPREIISALPTAIRSHWRVVAISQGELRLLQSPRLQRSLQVDGGASWQAHLGLRPIGIAVPCPLLPSPLRAAKVQFGVCVLHAMVGRLEVLQDELACLA